VRRALLRSLDELGERDLPAVVRRTVQRLRQEGVGLAPGPAGAAEPFGSLAGRVALVTGAASGIGQAVAVALAQAGARVAAGSFRGDPHPVQATLAQVQAVGGEALAADADVRSSRELEAACRQAVERWGRLDVVVANAGLLRRDPLGELTDERWEQVLDVDLGGVLRTCRAAAGAMGRGGSMIVISSIAGAVYGWAEHAHYAAAKAGVVGLARSLALELAPRGIRVNVLAPGLIETPQSLDPHASLGAEGLRGAEGSVPLGRIGRPQDVAAVVRFLASDAAGYVTGQTLVVDGGLTVDMGLG
jgi:3-oxoacyl-[acyl-carrier protein] reductase